MSAASTAAASRMVRLRGVFDKFDVGWTEKHVTCAAEDLLLAARMLREYIEILDGIRDDMWYTSHYRHKFLHIADYLDKAEDPSVTSLPSCYAETVLIISMFRDQPIWEGTAVDTKEFRRIADRLSAQIGYDYDAALAKCRKKSEKADDDVGGDAMELMFKKSRREAEAKKKEEKP